MTPFLESHQTFFTQIAGLFRLLDSLDSFLESRTVLQNVNLHLCPLDRDLFPIELPLVSEQLLHGDEVFGLDRDRVAGQNAVVYAQVNAGEEDPGDLRAYREAGEQRVRRLARRDTSCEPELRSVSHRPSLLYSSARRGSLNQAAPSRGAKSA